jgi:demethylmenaquinone methyltransferase/2-methoxy-6-polyprenyl-1,4-benzoquinol methylase
MDPEKTNNGIHFGFRQVSEEEKPSLVDEVFHAVATRYDLMNDLMSFGMHRLWKDFAVGRSGVRRGHTVLDVAAGTCDLTHRFVERVGYEGKVIAVDVSRPMLRQGKGRMIDRGVFRNVTYVLSDAENLAFADQQFDCVSIGFGLRNVTRIQSALVSMFRVLRPGGRIVVLEFSHPVSSIFSRLYDRYSFSVIPRIGQAVTGEKSSYQYLVESIRQHPNQEVLRKMMEEAEFEDVHYHNLSGGIVALHVGFRY